MIGSLQFSFNRRPFLAAALLVGALAAAYLNALHGAFVWDDIPSIVQNRSIEHIGTVLNRPAAVNTTSGRPLVSLSLGLNYALGGRNPLGFHVLNVLVHAMAALALFGFVRRVAMLPGFGGRYARNATGLALGVAAVWALHPLQTQAVTYVIQRAESLMGLCYFLTLWLFLRSADSPHPGLWRALTVVACASGMMAKEVMVSAPVMVLLLDRTFLAGSFRRAIESKKLFYAALFATWAILLLLVASLGGNRDGSTGGFSTHAAWVPYWMTQFPAIATYLKLAFLPSPLIFQYGPFWMPSATAAMPAALIVVPLVILTIVALFHWPEPGFFGFWFFSVLAVTSIVPGTADMIVDYRMYVALAPLWILAAAVLCRCCRRPAPFVLGAVALVLAAVTVARNRDYRSPLALWTDDVAKRPGDALAHYNLAVELLRLPGREADAEKQLETAVTLQPELAPAHYNLALLLSHRPDEVDKAIAHYEAAVRIAPRYAQAQNNLAVLLDGRGQLERACRHFQLAVLFDPSNRTAWLNLVRVLDALHRSDDALAACVALVRAHPDFADGQAELGILFATRNRQAEAIPHLEAAIRRNPSLYAAKFYLGSLLARQDARLPEATSLLEQVVRQRPDSASARFNLGTAYLESGNRILDAIAQFSAAVRLDPRNADAQFNLAGALEAEGAHRTEAIAHYRAAVELQPNAAVGHFRLARLLAADPRTCIEARAEVLKALALDAALPGARALLMQLTAGGPSDK